MVVYSSHSESRDWLFPGSSPFCVTGRSQSASMGCSRPDRYWPAVCSKEACSVLSFSSLNLSCRRLRLGMSTSWSPLNLKQCVSLSVLLDSSLTIASRVRRLSGKSFYHLRQMNRLPCVSHLRKMLPQPRYAFVTIAGASIPQRPWRVPPKMAEWVPPIFDYNAP